MKRLNIFVAVLVILGLCVIPAYFAYAGVPSIESGGYQYIPALNLSNAGSASAPSLIVAGDTKTGIYAAGTNELDGTANQSQVWKQTTTQFATVGSHSIDSSSTMSAATDPTIDRLSVTTPAGVFGARGLTRQTMPHVGDFKRFLLATLDLTTSAAFTTTGSAQAATLNGNNGGAGAAFANANGLDNNFNLVKMTTGNSSGDRQRLSPGADAFTVGFWTWKPRMTAVVRTDTTTNVRIWVGMTAGDLGAADTSTTRKAAFRYTTGAVSNCGGGGASACGTTNWIACTSDNTTETCLDTGQAFAGGTTYTFQIDCFADASCDFFINNVAVGTSGVGGYVTKTTNLPNASATAWGYEVSVTTLTTASALLEVSKVHVEQD